MSAHALALGPVPAGLFCQEENYSTQELKAFYDLGYNSLLLFELAFALAMHTTYKIFRATKEQGKPRRFSDLVMPLSYAICSAIIGTQSVIQAKCFSELLALTLSGKNQMASKPQRPYTGFALSLFYGELCRCVRSGILRQYSLSRLKCEMFG